MDRRSFMKLAGATGITSAIEKSNPAFSRNAKGKLRQAIVILGESVRYDMLNCNAKTGLQTPNLDRMATAGVRFERAYNCQPVCAPARSAIWTGLYPHTNAVWGNSMPLGQTEHSIGQILTDRGIHSGFVGKWHLDGVDYFGTGRPAPGWDASYWYDMRDYLNELSPADRVRSRNPATGDDPSWTADYCYGHRCSNRAIDFLAKHRNEDFLLVVAYDEPHHPSLCPIEYSEMYRHYVFPENRNVGDTLQNKPGEQRVWAGGRLARVEPPFNNKQFFGAHTFIDHEIGRVLDAIEEQAPSALVLYTSDHGVFLGSHRLIDKGPAMYDEITRIPFLAKWPGYAPANVSSPSLVSHIDISGTLMEFFGFEVPKTFEGGSVLSLLKNPAISDRKEVFMEWGRYEVDHDGFGGFQPIRCICDGRYKLSIHLMTSDELYDLHNDPSELMNLIDSPQHVAIRNDLHDRLLNGMNTCRDPFRGYYWGRRSWRPEFPETWENAGMTRQREEDGYLPRELDYDSGLPMKTATRTKH
jgi:uncharacterized sulfatase